ncbi:MAG: DUF2339 domain-containing protein [Candidatus Riflebacteria bacterium]|nr:DUF2339 domain-containing protein [Candidatus Riflebacteria bacterium]
MNYFFSDSKKVDDLSDEIEKKFERLDKRFDKLFYRILRFEDRIKDLEIKTFKTTSEASSERPILNTEETLKDVKEEEISFGRQTEDDATALDSASSSKTVTEVLHDLNEVPSSLSESLSGQATHPMSEVTSEPLSESLSEPLSKPFPEKISEPITERIFEPSSELPSNSLSSDASDLGSRPEIHSDADSFATKKFETESTSPEEEPDSSIISKWKNFDFENFLGVKLFAWLGGFAFFLGMAYFVKLSIDNDWLTIGMRLVIGFVLGAASISGGLILSRKGYALTVQSLCAAGVAILYADSVAAKLYGYFGTHSTLAALVSVTIVSFLLAVKLDSRFVAILGLIGGFLTPPILSTGSDNPLGLFSYITLLNCGLAAVVYRKGWGSLVCLSSIGTLMMEFGWVNKYFAVEKIHTGMIVFLWFSFFFMFVSQIIRKRFPDEIQPLNSSLFTSLFSNWFSVYLLTVWPIQDKLVLILPFVFLLNFPTFWGSLKEVRGAEIFAASQAAVYLQLLIFANYYLTGNNYILAILAFAFFPIFSFVQNWLRLNTASSLALHDESQHTFSKPSQSIESSQTFNSSQTLNPSQSFNPSQALKPSLSLNSSQTLYSSRSFQPFSSPQPALSANDIYVRFSGYLFPLLSSAFVYLLFGTLKAGDSPFYAFSLLFYINIIIAFQAYREVYGGKWFAFSGLFSFFLIWLWVGKNLLNSDNSLHFYTLVCLIFAFYIGFWFFARKKQDLSSAIMITAQFAPLISLSFVAFLMKDECFRNNTVLIFGMMFLFDIAGIVLAHLTKSSGLIHKCTSFASFFLTWYWNFQSGSLTDRFYSSWLIFLLLPTVHFASSFFFRRSPESSSDDIAGSPDDIAVSARWMPLLSMSFVGWMMLNRVSSDMPGMTFSLLVLLMISIAWQAWHDSKASGVHAASSAVVFVILWIWELNRYGVNHWISWTAFFLVPLFYTALLIYKQKKSQPDKPCDGQPAIASATKIDWRFAFPARIFPIFSMSYVLLQIMSPDYPNSPAFSLTLLVLLDLISACQTLYDDASRPWNLAASVVSSLLVLIWINTSASESNLSTGLVFLVIFALIHSALPILIQKMRPTAQPYLAGYLFAPLMMILLLVPVLNHTSVSFIVFPAVILLNVLSLIAAWIMAWLWAGLGMMIISMIIFGSWAFRTHNTFELFSLFGMELIVVIGFQIWGLFCATKSVFSFEALKNMSRKIFGIDSDSMFEEQMCSLTNPDRMNLVFLPALSAFLPFVFLISLVIHLKNPDPNLIFGFALLMTVLLLRLVNLLKLDILCSIAFICVAFVEFAWKSVQVTPGNAGITTLWYTLFWLVFFAYPFIWKQKLVDKFHPWLVSSLGGVIQFYLLHELISAQFGNRFIGFLPLTMAFPNYFWGMLKQLSLKTLSISALISALNSLTQSPSALHANSSSNSTPAVDNFSSTSSNNSLHLSSKISSEAEKAELTEPASSSAEFSDPLLITRLALYGGVTLFFLTAVFPVQFDREWLTLGWSLEGAALLWLFAKLRKNALMYLGVALLLISFARLGINAEVFNYYPRIESSFFNWFLYAYSVCAAALIAGAWFLPDDSAKIFNVKIKPLLYFLGVILLFMLLNIEIANHFSTGSIIKFNFSGNIAQSMGYSLGWSLFALLLLSAGIKTGKRGAILGSLGLLTVTILKVFLMDLWSLKGPYKVASLMGLAVTLIVVSFLYQHYFPKKK